MFTTIDVPSATGTIGSGINTRGEIVGYYFDTAGAVHGFLLSKGVLTAIDFPGATDTFAFKINSPGQIVGAVETIRRSVRTGRP